MGDSSEEDPQVTPVAMGQGQWMTTDGAASGRMIVQGS